MNYQEMKDELWKAFRSNLPIKVNVIENGRMVVKEISPDSADYTDMYTKQSEYLNEKIHPSSVDTIMDKIKDNNSDSFKSEEDKLMDEIHNNTGNNDKSKEKTEDTSEPKTEDIKQAPKKDTINNHGNIALVKKDDHVYIIGNITEEEVKKEGNQVFEAAKKLSNKLIVCNTANCKINTNYSTKSGISFTIDSDQNIKIFGNFDKVEYMDYLKPQSKDNYLESILKNASKGHKIITKSLIERYGIDNVWDKILKKLDSKEMSLEELKKFVIDIQSIYDQFELVKYDIFNSNYKKIINKYPIEDELYVNLSSIIGYARNGFKKGIISIISIYGVDNIWIDIADSLKNKKITKKEYEEFVNNLKKTFSKEEIENYQIFTNKHFKALQEDKILYEDGSEELGILTEDKMDHKTVPSKANNTKGQKVKSRKQASESLKTKFFTKVNKAKKWWQKLSPATKCAIAGATIIAIGVGVAVLNASTIKDILENFSSSLNMGGHLNPSSASQVTNTNANPASMNTMINSLKNITDQAHQTFDNLHNAMQSSGVNWDALGEGHIGYKTAADAINGTNGVTLSNYFGQEPSSGIIDVYNTVTGWMHLTKEQLNNPEIIKSLSQDPNNAIHFKDAWFNLSDIAGEIIKGGKVL